jgi:hypothetical protein
MVGPMKNQANQLLAKEIPRTDGQPGIYGPQFRLTTPQAGTGSPLTSAGAGASVSFAANIKPCSGRSISITCETWVTCWTTYWFMSDPAGNHANATSVYDSLNSKRMPPGRPYWSDDQLRLFSSWMAGGYKP